jgi:ribosome assembly protein 1
VGVLFFLWSRVPRLTERVTLRGRRNSEKINLNLRILTRDHNSKDRSNLLSLIWLPQAIIDVIPSPHGEMLDPDLSESHADPKSKLEKDPYSSWYSCDASESAHVVGYVSKMFAVPTAQLPLPVPSHNSSEPLTTKA